MVALLAWALACSPAATLDRVVDRRYGAAGAVERWVELPGTHVRYDLAGADHDGVPILLVHGFGADAHTQWALQVGALARRHTVIVPDLVGFGGSRTLTGRADLGLQTDVLQAVLDAEGVERAHVVGISYGGLTALRLAMVAPERVERLVVVDAPGPDFTPERYAERMQALGVADVKELVVPPDVPALRRLLDVAFVEPPRVGDRLLADIHRRFYAGDRTYQEALLDAVLTDERARAAAAAWTGFPRPSLVIWGAEDPLFPVDQADTLARRIGPSARVVVLPGAAHAPIVERSRAFNAALLGFLVE